MKKTNYRKPSKMVEKKKWILSLFAAAIAWTFAVSDCCMAQTSSGSDDSSATQKKPFFLVVMDPLSDKLACDCVEGYAQRKYQHLARHLSGSLDRPVTIAWAQSISAALEEVSQKPDLIIGKHSVVLSDAKGHKLKLRPIASLTDQQGKTTQTGLLAVRSEDPAQTMLDLEGYRFFFGPKDSDEKNAAPKKLLKEFGITIPEKEEISGACSEATTKLMELPKGTKAVAIVSSYAKPLLEGCGSVNKGDLRVIGETGTVRFITAFVNTKTVSKDDAKALTKALLEVKKQKPLLKHLETKSGFVAFKKKAKTGSSSEKKTDVKKKLAPSQPPK